MVGDDEANKYSSNKGESECLLNRTLRNKEPQNLAPVLEVVRFQRRFDAPAEQDRVRALVLQVVL